MLAKQRKVGRYTEMKFDYQKLYEERLPMGQKFQDHCAALFLQELHIPLVNFQSKDWQFKIGENAQGFEIKYDQHFSNTGNFWIEVQQRITPEQNYYSAGIYQKDNAWMYCIGDYSVLYLFGKHFLQLLHKSNRFEVIENNLKTSRGFLLPKTEADKYFTHKIETPEGFVDHIGNNA